MNESFWHFGCCTRLVYPLLGHHGAGAHCNQVATSG